MRQAMTTLTHAAVGNPRVPAPLQAAVDQAARAMGLGVPVEQFIAAVEKVMALTGLDARPTSPRRTSTASKQASRRHAVSWAEDPSVSFHRGHAQPR